MSEDSSIEVGMQSQETEENEDKRAFLKSSDTTVRIIDGLNLQGFQLGGGAIDFALGKYRRPHSDIDIVYVVESRTWDEYVSEPNKVPEERLSLQNVNQEPELYGVQQTNPIAMERMGAPGIQMKGGELPLVVDFIEAYRSMEDGEEYIMLPIYEGGSYIKIPQKEIIEKKIDNVIARVPTAEMQLLLKEQCASVLESLKGGLLPDRRRKASKDMEEVRREADLNKVKKLKEKKMGLNYSFSSTAKYRTAQILQIIAR